MLPNILSVAEEHGLMMNQKTLSKQEVLCKCPFCHEDANQRGKYYLSLNVNDHVFKCWYCKESGGVFRFISLLSGVPESEVIQKHREQNGKKAYKLHPVEELTASQMKLMGFRNKPNWFEMRKRDYAYFKRTLEHVWAEWQDYLDSRRRLGFQILLMGIKVGKYSQALQEIEKLSKETGYNLLPDLFHVYGSDQRPGWAEDAHILVEETYNGMRHRQTHVTVA